MSSFKPPRIEVTYDELPAHLRGWHDARSPLPQGAIYVPFEELPLLWSLLGAPLALLFILAGASMGLSILEDMTQALWGLGLVVSAAMIAFGVWILYKLQRLWRRHQAQRDGRLRYGVLVTDQDVVIFDERATWFLREQLLRATQELIRQERSSYLVLNLDISLVQEGYVRHTILYSRLSHTDRDALELTLKVELAALKTTA